MLKIKEVIFYIVQISLFYCIMINPVYAKRIALVIGNSDYKESELKNPVNDAQDMSLLLKQKGFEVILIKNATKRQMTRSIRLFTSKLYQEGVIGLFYFAGHGVEVDNRNYLIPVNIDIKSEEDVEFEGVDVGRVLSGMHRAKNNLNIIILDACRNNPFLRSFRTSSQGLAKITVPKGQLILYATSPGEVAADGIGRNGLFTEHLMEAIDSTGLTVEQVFKKTAISVSKATNGKQIPWQTGVILGEFYFTKKEKIAALKKGTSPIDNTDAEIAFWRSIENNQNPVYFTTYLAEYGRQGRFAALAKLKLEELKPTTAKQEINAKIRLTINTIPEKAKIRILNIKQKYKKGIELEPGEYHVEVTSPGHERILKWITLKPEEKNKIISIALDGPNSKIVTTSKSKKSGLDMVTIPGGCFQRSNPESTKTEHLVCLDGFNLGKYEVTRGEFKQFIRSTGYRTESEWNIAKKGCYSIKNNLWDYHKGMSWRNPGFHQHEEHPVSCVSWNDIMIYIDWLNKTTKKHYRLPTQDEWEYAARAGISTNQYWGDKRNNACMYANVAIDDSINQFTDWTANDCNDGENYTSIVGKYKENFFGLNDMLGNVWEWTCSKFEKSTNAESQCIYGDADRIIRGGSWINRVNSVGFDSRLRGNQSNRANFIGFRLVAD